MISIRNLSKKYENCVLFKNYNYEFENEKIYCLQGDPGSGKTTFLRIIAGLTKPDGGNIFYNDIMITKPNKNILLLTTENHTKFPWKTCLENILHPIRVFNQLNPLDKEKASNILDEVGLGNYIEKLPSEIPNDMNQFLSLASILMLQPDVVLLDNPFNNINPSKLGKINDLLHRLHDETKNTIIMISHEKSDLKKMGDVTVKIERSA